MAERMQEMKWLAYSLAILVLAFFSYVGFPGSGRTLWYFAMGCLMLRPGICLDGWGVPKAWLFSMTGVGLGLLARYVVEYGEHSWKLAFTGRNVLLYLLMIPVYVILLFHGLRWCEQYESGKTD